MLSLALGLAAFGTAVLSGLLGMAGGLVQTLQIVGGVGGPLLDVFFLDGRLDRHGVVATKAATQALSHLAKIGWWGGLVGSGELSGDTAALVVGAALVGTRVGTWLLARLAEADFRRATRVVVRVVGAAYVAWGLGLIP